MGSPTRLDSISREDLDIPCVHLAAREHRLTDRKTG